MFSGDCSLLGNLPIGSFLCFVGVDFFLFSVVFLWGHG